MKDKEDLKIAVLIGDGMADYPVDALGGKTPLEFARTPHMDFIARNGLFGLTRTVPEGMSPGSDTANLSIFGYDPRVYYTGRAPLEALNMGISMEAGDAAFRCNIVKITEGSMDDFTAHHIETEFSRIVLEEISRHLKFENIEFYSGVSYRNLMIWRNFPYPDIPSSTPPHDITGKTADSFLPSGDGAERLREIMKMSAEVILQSQVIRDALPSFKGDPTSIWLWGGGRKPSMETIKELYNLEGYTISAVDLIHGIGRAAGLSPLRVEGATGYIDTNYSGKADALLMGLERADIVFLHVESPDESGHEGNIEHKIKSIEDFDKLVVGRVFNRMNAFSNHAILLMPDHPTPLSLRTHTDDPVPFVLYRNRGETKTGSVRNDLGFNERDAASTGVFIAQAHELLSMIVRDRGN